MAYRTDHLRRGMTLVELLVVVMILGLLAVVAAPAVNPSSSKRKLRDAATTVSSHLMRAVSRALGSRTGSGAWLEADSTNPTSPTTLLRSCAGTAEATGTITLTASSPTSGVAACVMNPSYAVLAGSTTVPAGTMLQLVGLPYDYFVLSGTSLSLTGSSAINIWPKQPANGFAFNLQVPPNRSLGEKTAMPGNTCVDLPSSTFGVYGYSPTSDIVRFANDTPVRITFDNVGKPRTVTATFAGKSRVEQRRMEPRMPIAILVGFRDQVGLSYAPTTSDDAPGPNWQRKDGWWVVVDPRTSTVFQIENLPNATSISEAQRFIRQRLLNDSTVQ